MGQIVFELRIRKNEKFIYRVTIEKFETDQKLYVNFRECSVGGDGFVSPSKKGLTLNTKFLPEVMAAMKKAQEFLMPSQQGTSPSAGGQNNPL